MCADARNFSTIRKGEYSIGLYQGGISETAEGKEQKCNVS
jgi:hypothetical protein